MAKRIYDSFNSHVNSDFFVSFVLNNRLLRAKHLLFSSTFFLKSRLAYYKRIANFVTEPD